MGVLDLNIRGIALHSPGDTVWVRGCEEGVLVFAPQVFSTKVKAIRIEFSDPDQKKFSLYYITENGVYGADRVFFTETAARVARGLGDELHK